MRKVYFDFQDGNNFIDVSHAVKYDTFQITTRAFNDSYRAAQNEATFDLIYDPIIFPLMRYLTKEVIVRIVDIDGIYLTTENQLTITTESDIALIVEQDVALPIFYGTIPPTRAYSYNGILNNTTMTVEAIDEMNKLDIPVGDVLYANCKVANSADTAHSLIHLLAGIAGFTVDRINPTLSIPTVLARFAPTDPEDTVRDVLDTLLYEYGYVLNMSGASTIDPIRWIYPEGTTAEYTFDETNIIKQAQVRDGVKKYDGAEVIYYELKTAEKVLMYRDDNCGYADDGSFAGYPIPAGYDYPPEANVIDEVTGQKTVVYQEYTDDSIKYWTNKAIQNNLDYNYKAFSSNFSAMVATENHFLDNRLDTGLTNTVLEFLNTKCRIVYNNPTGDSNLRVYYNNVYADVWYKSTERTSKIDGTNVNKYTTEYTFVKSVADNLVKALDAQYKVGHTTYSFLSEDSVDVGALVDIVMGDGTNQMCFIREKAWSEQTEQFTYSLVSASSDKGVLTSEKTSISVAIPPVDLISSKLTPELVSCTANTDGSSPVLTYAFTRMLIMKGGADVSMDWTYSATPLGVTGSFGTGADKNLYTISAFNSNSDIQGTVIITATKTNWITQSKTFVIKKDHVADAVNGGDVTGIIPTVTPKYIGIVIVQGISSSAGTIYYVSGTPAFVTGAVFNANVGDWAFIRGIVGGAGDEVREIRVWTGAVWTAANTTNYHRTTAAQDLMSVCKIYGTPTSGDSYEWFNSLVANQAFLDFLQARIIKLSEDGAMYGGDRFNADGTDNSPTANGFWMGSNGTMKAENGYFSGTMGQEGKISIKDYYMQCFNNLTPNNLTRKLLLSANGLYWTKYNSSTTLWEDSGAIRPNFISSTDKKLYADGDWVFTNGLDVNLLSTATNTKHGSFTSGDLFTATRFTVPNVGDKVKCTGGVRELNASYMERISATQILVYGMFVGSYTSGSYTFTEGNATVLAVSITF